MSPKTNLIIIAILFIVPSLAFKSKLEQQMPEGKLILMDTNTGASCLDGSPTGFYLKNGRGLDTDKWLVYFMGGRYNNFFLYFNQFLCWNDQLEFNIRLY